MQNGLIKYIAIVVVIVVLVFLSQQAYFSQAGKDLVSKASNLANGYWTKGSDWAKNEAYSKISEEVQKRGEIIKNEVNSEKEKVSENIGTKISNYISGVTNSIVHPGTSQTCPTNQTSSTDK